MESMAGLSAQDLVVVSAMIEHAPVAAEHAIDWALIQFKRFKKDHRAVYEAVMNHVKPRDAGSVVADYMYRVAHPYPVHRR
jgi:hypothetical protein